MSLLVRRTYASAPYAFFRVHNYEQAQRDFLDSGGGQPVFAYAAAFTPQAIERRRLALEEIASDAADAGDQLLSAFVNRRLEETALLRSFWRLHDKPESRNRLDEYREHMEKLYGTFDPELLAGVLHYLQQRAAATGQDELFADIQERISFSARAITKARLYQPGADTFAYYRAMLMTGGYPIARMPKPAPETLTDRKALTAYFSAVLALDGAADKGWTVRDGRAGTNVAVSRHKRRIIIGKHYTPQTLARLKQVAAHEILVHVRRNILRDEHQPLEEEEGVAIMVEQLLSRRFMYRRMLRYLAAAIAWGVDGRPRDFSLTFDVMWRACMIVSGCSKAVAQKRAFAECTRVFRGGVPSVAGAAFIKDKVYFEANLSLWRSVEDNKLSQAEFMALLDGYTSGDQQHQNLGDPL